MSHQEHPAKIVAIVGLPGSGKSEAVRYISESGHPKVYFGGVILDAMKERGIELTEANEKQFREEIREREGKDFVVKHIITELHDLIAAGQRRIIADGVYTWTEFKTLKHEFPGELTVIAVVAPRLQRIHRLANREHRPLTPEEVNSRDWAEIENLEKGGPIAIADYFIHNDSTIEHFHERLDETLREIEF